MMRKSIILLEIIFTIVLLSIIYLTTTKFIFAINEKNKINYTTTLTKLEFETTRLFLIATLQKEQCLNEIKYIDKKLYFNDNILQDNVNKFNLTKLNDVYKVEICINLYDDICQSWIIK